MPFKSLNSAHIIETLEHLADRVRERFPDASLNNVVTEVIELGKRDRRRSERLARPYIFLRMGTAAAIIGAVIALAYMGYWLFSAIGVDGAGFDIFNIFEGVEAGLNIVILAAVAIFTLSRIEERLKRSLALDDLHELRSIAHIIDMHQLTKDPTAVLKLGPRTASSPTAVLKLGPRTASSPTREMSDFELSRYLDYCAELLSLAGKIAALYAQSSRDPVVIAAVNDIESLTSNMSAKIWQKIIIVRESA